MNRDREADASPLVRRSTPEPQFDAAHAMLNRMRLIAESRGEARIDAKRAAAIADRQAAARSRRAKRTESAMYDNGRDPLGVGAVMDRLVRNRGWSSPVAVGSVLAEWDALVGPQIATHCRPESFEASTVVVRCDSSSWATQLRLLSHNLLKTFDEKLGHGVVTTIQVLGPQAPSWRHGRRTVDGRGPRDTYG